MVDIIVAVGGRLDWFRKCITAVRRNTDAAYRLIVVDDCGNAHESERLVEILGEIPVGMNECETPELIRHEKRVGYTLSANDGLAARGQGRSVVLLNTDAVVGPNWLSGMVRAATGGVGYVNPVSNRSGNGFDIQIPQGENVNSMVRILRDINAPDIPSLNGPTGFCLLCTPDALALRDRYDAEKWPAGYGCEAENWILASRTGMRAAMATTSFVFHAGWQSIGTQESQRLGGAARQRLHGEYGNDITAANREWSQHNHRWTGLKAKIADYGKRKDGERKLIFALWSANNNGASSLRFDFGGVSAPIHLVDELVLQGHDATVMLLGGIPQGWRERADQHLFSAVSGVTPEAAATRALSRWDDAAVVAATMGSSYAARDMANASGNRWSAYAFCQDDEPRFHEDTKQPNVFDANFNKILEARRDYYRTGINGVCVSKFAADAWRRYSGTDPVAIIPPGVDTAIFAPGEKPEHPVVVGFHRKHRRRNPGGLAATFQLIRQQRPDVELVAIGKEGMPLPGVRNTGELDRTGVARELARAHILIEPSIYQGFGLPALEAMACGCVPICAANGGIEEYGVDGENCIIVENNPREFANAAIAAIEHRAHETMRDACVATARRFAPPIPAKMWSDLLGGKAVEPITVPCADTKREDESLVTVSRKIPRHAVDNDEWPDIGLSKYITEFSDTFGILDEMNGDFFGAVELIKDITKDWTGEKARCWLDFWHRQTSVFHTAGVKIVHRNKPVVLVSSHWPYIGGVEFMFAHLGHEFARRGYDVAYVFWRDLEVVPWIASLPTIKLPHDNGPNWYPQSRVAAFAKLYDALKPKAVLNFWFRDAVEARAMSIHKPRILEWMDGVDTASMAKADVEKRPDLAPDVFASESDRGAKRLSGNTAKVPVVTVGAPTVLAGTIDGFDLGVPAGKKLIVRVARCIHVKGPGLFNQLMRNLGPDYFGVWIGPVHDTVSRIAELAPENTRYIGPVFDPRVIETYISQAHAVVSTTVSNLEGLSNVLIQAMCYEVPIVVTRSGHTEALFERGEVGRVLPLNVDGAEFAKAVATISSTDRARYAANSRKWKPDFDLKTAADKWESLF